MVTVKITLDDHVIGDIVCVASKAYALISQFSLALHEPTYAAGSRVRIAVISRD